MEVDRISADTVRLALLNYHTPSQLALTPFVQWAAVKSCFLDGDEQDNVAQGYAVQALLSWGIETLGQNDDDRWRQSYETLQWRYIEKRSVLEHADLCDITESAAQKRRIVAVERLTERLNEELLRPIATLRRQAKMIVARYQSLDSADQERLRLLALVNRPIPFAIDDILPMALTQNRDNLLSTHLVQQERHTLFLPTPVQATIFPFITWQEQQKWVLPLADFFRQQGKVGTAIELLWQGQQLEMVAQWLIDYRQFLTAEEQQQLVPRLQRGVLDNDLWAQIKLLAGQLARDRGDLGQAIIEYQIALTARRPLLRAKAYYELARLHCHTDLRAALQFYEMGIQGVKDEPSAEATLLHAQLLIDRSWVFIEQRPDYPLAEENLREAHAILQQYAKPELWVDWHNAQAHLHRGRKEQDQEAEHLWRGWQFAQEIGDSRRSCRLTYNLGTLYYHQQKYQLAESYYETSQQLAKESHDETMIALNDKGLGYCAFGRKEWEEAILHYQRAYESFSTSDDKRLLSAVCYDLAEALFFAERWEEGEDSWQKGVASADAVGDERLRAEFQLLFDQFPQLNKALNERQRRIFNWLRQQKSITNQQYRTLNQCSKKSAENDLAHLIELGLIARQGQGRSTSYQLAI